MCRFSAEEIDFLCQETRDILRRCETHLPTAKMVPFPAIHSGPRAGSGTESGPGIWPDSVPPGSHDPSGTALLSSCDWEPWPGPGFHG